MIEYCLIPSFRRLVAFLKNDDVSGYGCIAINDSISIWQFVTEIEEQSKHPVAVIDFITQVCQFREVKNRPISACGRTFQPVLIFDNIWLHSNSNYTYFRIRF